MSKVYLEKKTKVLTEIQSLVDLAQTESRVFTDEEKTKYEGLKAELEGINAHLETLSIDTEAELKAIEDAKANEADKGTGTQAANKFVAPNAPAPEATKEFSSFGEFLFAATCNKNDARLNYAASGVKSDMSMGEGAGGGFAVPVQFRSEIMAYEPDASLIRPGATVIEAGTPPDSAVLIPALDQEPNGTHKTYGGVQVSWIAEGGAKPETDADLRQIKLEPQEVAAFIPITDKLLRNWPSAESFLSGLLRRAVLGAEDEAFLSGDGVGKPLGIRDSGAALLVNRDTASDVIFLDIKAMYSRFVELGGNTTSSVWVASRSAFERLLSTTDDGGGSRNIISVDQSTGTVTMYGIPVVRHGRGMATLGSKGDFMLIDRASYLIKDGSGPFIAASEHVEFVNNKTLVKVYWNVDGQPWLTKPTRDENDFEVSPFVVLDVP